MRHAHLTLLAELGRTTLSLLLLALALLQESLGHQDLILSGHAPTHKNGQGPLWSASVELR